MCMRYIAIAVAIELNHSVINEWEGGTFMSNQPQTFSIYQPAKKKEKKTVKKRTRWENVEMVSMWTVNKLNNVCF